MSCGCEDKANLTEAGDGPWVVEHEEFEITWRVVGPEYLGSRLYSFFGPTEATAVCAALNWVERRD